MKKATWVSGIILFFLMTFVLVPIAGAESALDDTFDFVVEWNNDFLGIVVETPYANIETLYFPLDSMFSNKSDDMEKDYFVRWDSYSAVYKVFSIERDTGTFVESFNLDMKDMAERLNMLLDYSNLELSVSSYNVDEQNYTLRYNIDSNVVYKEVSVEIFCGQSKEYFSVEETRTFLRSFLPDKECVVAFKNWFNPTQLDVTYVVGRVELPGIKAIGRIEFATTEVSGRYVISTETIYRIIAELTGQQYEGEPLSAREAIAYIESKLDWDISKYYFSKAEKYSLVIYVPAKEQWMYIELGESMTINYGMLDAWIAKRISG